MTYTPPAHIVNIAAIFNGEPIAHTERADGTIVIVMRDGRKLTYHRPAEETPAAQAQAGAEKPRRPGRKAKSK